MEFILTPVEIWQLAVIKLFFYLFLIFGIILFFKWPKPFLFVLLISLFLGGTYLFLIWQAQLPWWSLQGDEIFVTSFLQKVASGNFFSDFFYKNLPLFYPPLYFWLVGGLASFFKLNGIQAAQLGVALVLFLSPFLVYFCQKIYWRLSKKEGIPAWKLAVLTASVFLVWDWTAVILKPYEFISAILIVFWSIFLFQDLYFKTLSRLKIIIYGLGGGLLFLTFHFWFFPLALAILLFKLFVDVSHLYFYSRLSLIVLLILIIAWPFLYPLINSLWQNGGQNFQPLFFIPSDLNLKLPFFDFSILGLISIFGLLSIIFYWSKPAAKAMGILLGSIYFWQFLNLIGIIFWQVSVLPAKPFLFLGTVVLDLAFGYGIIQWLESKGENKNLQTAAFIIGWLVLSSQLLGGNFVDDPVVQKRLVEIKKPIREEFTDLIRELKTVSNLNNLVLLSSNIPEISAYLPLNYYLSYNIHFSHPAANFIDRYNFVTDLAASQSPDQFYQKIKKAPFQPIDNLLFLKGNGFYPINFWYENYPTGGIEQEIRIPSDLISEQYFAKIFEDKYFVFYKVK